MNAKAREIVEKIRERKTFGESDEHDMGYALDDDEAESIIAEALAEKDTEIARIWVALRNMIEFFGAIGYSDAGVFIEAQAALLPPDENEVKP